jgi:hypothetical protein
MRVKEIQMYPVLEYAISFRELLLITSQLAQLPHSYTWTIHCIQILEKVSKETCVQAWPNIEILYF